MPSSLSQRARASYRWSRKKAKRAQSHVWLRWLQLRNRFSNHSVLGSADAVVSLTTYGARLDSVAYTIESIGAGATRPRRLVLWLDDPEAFRRRPASLRRLEKRGLEVALTDNLGPHTKYYPVLDSAIDAGLPVVTADDDILYPGSWLTELLGAAAHHPGVINCYRASVVAVRGDGVAPYDSWPRCTDSDAGLTRFGTGVSGVHYPTSMLQELRRHGTEFLRTCPKADDIWLHWVALQARIPVRQIAPRARHFPLIPGTQAQSLMAANVDEGRNDEYVANLYGPAEVALLAEAGAPRLE